MGPILFADGNLNPVHLSIADDLRLLLATIQQNQPVSGLNINIRKTQVLGDIGGLVSDFYNTA